MYVKSCPWPPASVAPFVKGAALPPLRRGLAAGCSSATTMEGLQRLQAFLNFEGAVNPQFASKNGLGRTGVAGFLLGCLFGAHAMLGMVMLTTGIGMMPLVSSLDYF